MKNAIFQRCPRVALHVDGGGKARHKVPVRTAARNEMTQTAERRRRSLSIWPTARGVNSYRIKETHHPQKKPQKKKARNISFFSPLFSHRRRDFSPGAPVASKAALAPITGSNGLQSHGSRTGSTPSGGGGSGGRGSAVAGSDQTRRASARPNSLRGNAGSAALHVRRGEALIVANEITARQSGRLALA